MRGLQAQVGVQVDVHLHHQRLAGQAGAQLVDVGDAGVLADGGDDGGAVGVGRGPVQQVAGGVLEQADRPPGQPDRNDQARRRVQPRRLEEGARDHADQHHDVGGQVGGVVGAVARHGQGTGLLHRLGLRPHQARRDGDGQKDDAHGPAAGRHRARVEDALDRLPADEDARGQHHARLHQGGQALGLAVAVAMRVVGRGGGPAHGEEGGQRGHQVQRRIRQAGQDGDRARGPQGEGLHEDQQNRRRHRQGGDPARGLMGGVEGRGGHFPPLSRKTAPAPMAAHCPGR
ncbi:hypothetical protein D3C80_1225750 [compost metagenome]